MSQQIFYTTQLHAGLGLLEETRQLLGIYEDGMTPSQLYHASLASGRFPLITARRLRNIVIECFAPRYMRDQSLTHRLKLLANLFTVAELNQLFFIYTARANPIFADFVKEVYWNSYSAGKNYISLEDAITFVSNSVSEGKTKKAWSENTIKHVSSNLLSCCADYGLLTNGRKQREIVAYRILPKIAAYLTYELKFRGYGDNHIVSSMDWELFGMEHADVRDQLKRLSLQGLLIFQATSDVVHIGWTYKTMEELINVIAQS